MIRMGKNDVRFPHFHPVKRYCSRPAMTREGIAGVFDKQAADRSANKGGGRYLSSNLLILLQHRR